jgi:hypothetical protein
MDNKLLLQRLEEIFFKKLEEKTGWGRNLVKQRFKDSIHEVIFEMCPTDEKISSSPHDIKPGSFGWRAGDEGCPGTMGPVGVYGIEVGDTSNSTDSIKFSVGDTYNRNQKPE